MLTRYRSSQSSSNSTENNVLAGRPTEYRQNRQAFEIAQMSLEPGDPRTCSQLRNIGAADVDFAGDVTLLLEPSEIISSYVGNCPKIMRPVLSLACLGLPCQPGIITAADALAKGHNLRAIGRREI
jgi:hypothetical protein